MDLFFDIAGKTIAILTASFAVVMAVYMIVRWITKPHD